MADLDELEKRVNGIEGDQRELITRVELLTEQVQETKTLVESVHKLAISVERLTEAQKNMSTQLNKLQNNVDDIQKTPAKRWDLVISVVITAVVTTAITFLLK